MAQNPQAPVIQGSDGTLYGTTSAGGTGYAGTVFRLNKDGSGYSDLHSFGDGQVPNGLMEARDGALYGTTSGSVFKLNKDGSGYCVLHSFGNGADGRTPVGALVEGGDGALYGTTSEGGTTNAEFPAGLGTVFKLNKDGSGYSVLYRFGANMSEGQGPNSLAEGSDGVLYGTSGGGVYTNQYGYRLGIVFKVNKDGSGYSVLHSFGSGGDGEVPEAGLVEASDGALYGTTAGGGAYPSQYYGYRGTVFKVNKDGSGYRVLHSFGAGSDGQRVQAGLVEGSDGSLYGTATYGGDNGWGMVFKLSKDGSSYGVLHSFTGVDGGLPYAGLVAGEAGALYGATPSGGSGFGVVFKLSEDGTDYVIAHSFTNGDGQYPRAPLIQATDGALYGTTSGGGGYSGGDGKGGTVFKLNKDGSGYSVVYSFGSYATDGENSPWGVIRHPVPGLVEATDGVLYGMTSFGGASGAGTVFKLNKDGTSYRVLHNFGSSTTDGGSPYAGLVEGSDGALYGTTSEGGANVDQYGASLGTVFKLKKDGSGYTLLHSFGSSTTDGGSPYAGLVEGSDGALYGTTTYGGAYPGQNWRRPGTVFKLNKDGSGYSVLHNFGSFAGDGSYPRASLLEASDGALYGTTEDTVFRLKKDGSGYSVLVSLWGSAALIEGRDGALYGTSYDFLGWGGGTVFRLNKDGSSYTVLNDFGHNGRDGTVPQSGLVKGSDGALYGTTQSGGDFGFGTVFKLWPPETPDLLGVTAVTNTVQVSFAGVAGYQYQVRRSTDLSNWIVLTTITMPSDGTYTNVDNVPPDRQAYYRAAWVP